MSNKGEFKKLFRFYALNYRTTSGTNVSKDAELYLRKQEEILDEAKKEFPIWEEETSDEYRGTFIRFDGDTVKAWFLKWFGVKAT